MQTDMCANRSGGWSSKADDDVWAARQRARYAEEHPQAEDPGVDLSESTGEEVTSTPITLHHKGTRWNKKMTSEKLKSHHRLASSGGTSFISKRYMTINDMEVWLMSDVKGNELAAVGRA